MDTLSLLKQVRFIESFPTAIELALVCTCNNKSCHLMSTSTQNVCIYPVNELKMKRNNEK